MMRSQPKAANALANRRRYITLYLASALGFAGLAANVTGVVAFPGLHILAVLLLLLPTLYYCLFDEAGSQPKRRGVALPPFALAVFTQVILVASLQYPAGGDGAWHMRITATLLDGNGHIDFSRVDLLSFRFVGTYLAALALGYVASLEIVEIALLIPPILHFLTLSFVYMIFRRLTGSKPALLIVILLAVENSMLLIGQEFRTQIYATVVLLGALTLYVVSHVGRPSIETAIAGLAFLAALAISSFAVIAFAILMFGSVFGLPRLAKGKPLQSPAQFILFVLFSFGYILYLSGNPESVLGALVVLFTEVFVSQAEAGVELGHAIYGPFVRWFTFAFWALAGVIGTLLIVQLLNRREFTLLAVIMGFGAILGLGIASQAAGQLNVWRAYTFGIIGISSVVAIGLMRMVRVTRPKIRRFLKPLAVVLLVLFVAVSLAKLPIHVIGPLEPIRGPELIDTFPGLHASSTDSKVTAFVTGSCASHRTLHIHAVYPLYLLLNLYELGCNEPVKSVDLRGNLLLQHISKGDLVILRESISGHTYLYRERLPPSASYETFSLIYSSGDYFAYVRT